MEPISWQSTNLKTFRFFKSEASFDIRSVEMLKQQAV